MTQLTEPKGTVGSAKQKKYIKHGTVLVGVIAAPWIIRFDTLLVVTLLLLMVYPQRQRTLLHPFFLAAPILRLVDSKRRIKDLV